MSESYSSKVVYNSTPEQVAKLIRLDETAPEAWDLDDLCTMVRHQMSAPLEFDLRTEELSELEQKTTNTSLANSSRVGINTFGQLFQSPKPPLELLKLSHRFFKRNIARHPEGSPEWKAAYVFYLLSIVVARIRNQVKLSRLPDEDLLHSIKSVMDRSWVDESIRQLLVEGRETIGSAESRK